MSRDTSVGEELLTRMCGSCKEKVRRKYGGRQTLGVRAQAKMALWFLRHACRSCQREALLLGKEKSGGRN